MKTLNNKEIYELSQDLGFPYETTSIIADTLYNILLSTDFDYNSFNTNIKDLLNTEKDYFYCYYDLNCFVFDSLDNIIDGIFQQKCAELRYNNISQDEMYKKSINYVFKNMGKTIFKMNNDSYLQCCI